jgi:hypothetical protein
MVEKEFCMFYDEEIREIREIRADSGRFGRFGRFGKIREDSGRFDYL